MRTIAGQILPIVLAVAIFLALSLVNITLPGLYNDEALDVVPTMQLILGQPVAPVRGAALQVGTLTLPLMVMDYVGAVNTYLMLPFFALLGATVPVLRLMTILAAALAMLLGYLLARRLFDHSVAAMATLLVAVHPSYIFWSRMGIHVTSVMTVFALGSLLCLLRWWRGGHDRWLGVAGLLLGLGLWAKFLFLWWIIALAIAYIVVCIVWGAGPWSARLFGRWTVRRALWLGGGIMIGALPLIIYTVTTGGLLITLLRNAIITEYGVNNLDILTNIQAALGTFRVLMDGSYFWYQGGAHRNGMGWPLIALLSALAMLVAWKGHPSWAKGITLVMVIIASVIVQSAFTVSGIWATHLYLLLPLPQVLIAAIIASVARWAGRRRAVQAVLMVGGLLFFMLPDIRADVAYHADLVRSGGYSRFSDAIYSLAAWLDGRGIHEPVSVDWGMRANVQLLTQGRVNPVEIAGYAGEDPQAFRQRARSMLSRPGSVFLFHSKEDTVYERYPLFQEEAEALGVHLQIIEAFRDRSGAPVYVIWQAGEGTTEGTRLATETAR